MTAPAGVPAIRAGGRDGVATDRSTRMLGSARSLLLHGLAVLATAILLGIADAIALWMGALLVAVGLLIVAAGAALAGLVSGFNARSRHRHPPS